MPTVSVFMDSLFTSTEERRNSFQLIIKAIMPVDSTPEMHRGKSIMEKTCHSLAPSITAASSISLGSFLKKEINRRPGLSVWTKTYTESQNKKIKIETYLKQAWEKIRFLEGTDRAYIDQILDYTEYAQHDDAPDSAATMCRFFYTFHWDGKR